MTESPQEHSAAESTAEARAGIFDFLAALFASPPTHESLLRVREMARVFCAIRPNDGEMIQILCVANTSDWRIDDLVLEYHSLFVVPGPRYVAPYESVYRDAWKASEDLRLGPQGRGSPSRLPKGLLMGDSTLAVQRCYREAGVAPREGIPDHLSTELRFMALLYLKGSSTREDEGSAASFRAKFRDEHLLQWIDPLLKRVRESERLGFYPLVLWMTKVLLECDA